MDFAVKLSLIFITVVIVGWMLFATYLWSSQTSDGTRTFDSDSAGHFLFHLGVITVIILLICALLGFGYGVLMVGIVSGLGFIGLTTIFFYLGDSAKPSQTQ